MTNFNETATLTADPDLRFTPTGKAVVSIRIAVNNGYRNTAGEWVEGETTFLDGQLWSGAENVAKSLRKGMRVLIIGDVRQRSWENEAGERRSKLYLEVAEIGPSLRFATAQVTKVTRQEPAA